MFTGLIEEIGRIKAIQAAGTSRLITYDAPQIAGALKIGDSVAVDGVCQTVTALGRTGFSARAVKATLEKTTMGSLRRGTAVHLERALAMGDRLDGHIVQGHVSDRGQITSIRRQGKTRFLKIKLPDTLMRHCIPEGSIAVDGVSLTISTVYQREVEINLIPLTWESTNFKSKKAGMPVNIETDPLIRGNERNETSSGRITKENLQSWGF
jgi:riboflavin synthase